MPAINPGTEIAKLKYDLGGQAETSKITLAAADLGAFEVQTITFPATAGAAQADYVVIENVDGTKFAIWLDIDADGTAPTGAVYVASDTQIEVDIATGNTAAQVGTAVFAAIDGNITNVTVTNSGAGVITLTQTEFGNADAPVPKSADDGGAGSIAGATTTAGVASDYNSTYITLRSGADAEFYCWLNINSEGVDPEPSGTAIEATSSTGASVATLGAALATAIDGNANFIASHEGGGVVTVQNAATGNATDIGAGDMPGVTVSVQFQGDSLSSFNPGDSPSTLSNDPAVL